MYVDRRLAGLQAVQTLSRLNRAHPGKDTTYVLDFVNDADDVLVAFKAYHTTAALSATTDPHLVLNLRAKLDAAGYYDDFEVDRLVEVALDPKAKQGDLVAALARLRTDGLSLLGLVPLDDHLRALRRGGRRDHARLCEHHLGLRDELFHQRHARQSGAHDGLVADCAVADGGRRHVGELAGMLVSGSGGGGAGMTGALMTAATGGKAAAGKVVGT